MTNTISWIDPTGVKIDLPVQGRQGLMQRLAPPTAVTQAAVPFQAGGRAMSYRHDVRQVQVPLVLHDDPDVLRDQYRAWAYLLDPTRGDGTLRCTRGDGSSRDLTCRCTVGWDGLAEDYEHYSASKLTFLAIDDPYWRDATATEVDFTAASSTPQTLWFPFSFPFTFGASEVFSTQSFPNDGDVPVWPVWTIYGPGADLHIVNANTSQTLKLSSAGFALAAHQFIVIDTRPRRKTATRSDGASMFSALSLDSEMFSIAPGGAPVSVTMAGATTASLVAATYRQGYLAA